MTRTSWMTALAGAAMLLTGGAARAGVVPFDPALNAASPLLTDVQFRGGGFGQRIHGGGHRGGFGRHGGFGRGGFGHRGGFGRGGFRHGGFGYHRGYGYRHGYGYRRGYGGLGVGAGLAGFAAGAALGSTLAPGYGAPAYAYDGAAPAVAGDATAYCESRFKSYNRATGTYTGYDGLKHACP